MTDKEILYKVIIKAKNNGWKVNFPIKDIKEILTYNSYITPVVYYWIIFNHDFAKAFWGEGNIKTWWILLTDEIVNKPFTKLLNKKRFINKYNKRMYKECSKIIIPYHGMPLESISEIIHEQPNKDFINCFKKRYQKLVSYNTDDGWQMHLQQMILEKEPLKYLERYV